MPWRVSVGHTYSEGLLKNNDYERLSSSFRLSPVFLDGNLSVDFNTKLFSPRHLPVVDETSSETWIFRLCSFNVQWSDLK